MIHVSLQVAKVALNALRDLHEIRDLTPDQQDALLHLAAKVDHGHEVCSTWPTKRDPE